MQRLNYIWTNHHFVTNKLLDHGNFKKISQTLVHLNLCRSSKWSGAIKKLGRPTNFIDQFTKIRNFIDQLINIYIYTTYLMEQWWTKLSWDDPTMSWMLNMLSKILINYLSSLMTSNEKFKTTELYISSKATIFIQKSSSSEFVLKRYDFSQVQLVVVLVPSARQHYLVAYGVTRQACHVDYALADSSDTLQCGISCER